MIVFAGVGRFQIVPQKNTPSGQAQVDPCTLKVSVDMVVLNATEQNLKGAPVSGLDKNDFQVYEDGVQQQIKYFSHEDIPVTVGLVVDSSGSMRPQAPGGWGQRPKDLLYGRARFPAEEIFVASNWTLPDCPRRRCESKPCQVRVRELRRGHG